MNLVSAALRFLATWGGPVLMVLAALGLAIWGGIQ